MPTWLWFANPVTVFGAWMAWNAWPWDLHGRRRKREPPPDDIDDLSQFW